MDISKKGKSLSSAPYYSRGPLQDRIPVSPSVLPEIMLEKMRNVWEYFLGGPWHGDMWNFQGGICTLVKEREI